MGELQAITLLLLVLVSAASWLARVLGLPYPILLLVGGCLVGFVPGIPTFELDPDLVFYVFLPPLLYHAAYSSSAVHRR